MRRKLDHGNGAVGTADSRVGRSGSGVVTDGKDLLAVVCVIGSELLEYYLGDSGVVQERLAEYDGNGIGDDYLVGRLSVYVLTLVCGRTEEHSLHISGVEDTVNGNELAGLDIVVKVVVDVYGLKRYVVGEQRRDGGYAGRGKRRSYRVTELAYSCGEGNGNEAGVVGEEEGTKPRKVLMSLEQFEQYIEEYL